MKILYFFALICFVISCDSSSEVSKNQQELSMLPQAQGDYSSIVVVTDKENWEKQLKPVFQDLFCSEILGLYNPEHNFDLIHVSKKHFPDLLKRQRIVVEVEVGKAFQTATISLKGNRYARGQLFLKIAGPTIFAVAEEMEGKSEALIEKVENFRLQALQGNLQLNVDTAFANQILKKFSMSMVVPESYHLVDDQEHIMYFGKKAKSLCQSGRNTECYYQMGFMIHQLKYTNPSSFSKEFVVSLRDSLTKKFVHGKEAANQSFMKVEEKFPVSLKRIVINGHQGVEVRGWWDMKNATMGGPFRSYLLLNTETNHLMFLDGFVFAPNFNKRDFLMEIEAIARSVEFK